MYLDGDLVASLPPAANSGASADGSEMDGGHPLEGMGQGAIYLCARSDLNATRFFTGSVTHLAIWDEALEAHDIGRLWLLNAASVRPHPWSTAAAPAPMALYTDTASSFAEAAQPPREVLKPSTGLNTGSGGSAAPGPKASLRLTDTGSRCQFPFLFNGAQQLACVPMDSGDNAATYCIDENNHLARCSDELTAEFATFQSWLDQWTESGSLETDASGDVRLCMLNGTTVPETESVGCGLGYMCGPLTAAQRLASNQNAAPLISPFLGGPVPSPSYPFARSPLTECFLLQYVYANANLGPSVPSKLRFPQQGASSKAWACMRSRQQTCHEGDRMPYIAGPEIGVCAWGEGVTLPTGVDAPVPSAYFPMIDYNPASWPIPHLWFVNASDQPANQTSWVLDSNFGHVIQCSAASQQALVVRCATIVQNPCNSKPFC